MGLDESLLADFDGIGKAKSLQMLGSTPRPAGLNPEDRIVRSHVQRDLSPWAAGADVAGPDRRAGRLVLAEPNIPVPRVDSLTQGTLPK